MPALPPRNNTRATAVKNYAETYYPSKPTPALDQGAVTRIGGTSAQTRLGTLPAPGTHKAPGDTWDEIAKTQRLTSG